jgi:hypothetical protein
VINPTTLETQQLPPSASDLPPPAPQVTPQ